MKRIIDGATYDTETSVEVASGSHGHDASLAWWVLYQTNGGAFFEVVAGHDGVIDEFKPLTKTQAYNFLEVNANDLIEKYFGPMPEASKPDFSRRTLVAAINYMAECNTFYQAGITSLLNSFGPRVYKNVRGEEVSASKRLNDLLIFIDDNPRHMTDEGVLEDLVVRKAISLMPSGKQNPWDAASPPSLVKAAFARALEQDGFIVTDNVLRKTLPSIIGVPEVQSELLDLLNKFGLSTSIGHLNQALDAYTHGNWAAANSQTRTFFDSLTDDIALLIDPASASLSSGHARRTKLASKGFFGKDLNEWSDDGKGFINGLILRLHPQGSHPGLSDEDDCAFRIQTVQLTARMLLRRFHQRVGK